MNDKYAIDIVRALRCELNRIYAIEGNTERAIYISQELDKYILYAQKHITHIPGKKQK